MSGNELRRLDAKAADFDVTLKSLLCRDDPFDPAVLQTVQGIIADVRDRGGDVWHQCAVLDHDRLHRFARIPAGARWRSVEWFAR